MKKRLLALVLLALAAQSMVLTEAVAYSNNDYNGCCPGRPARRYQRSVCNDNCCDNLGWRRPRARRAARRIRRGFRNNCCMERSCRRKVRRCPRRRYCRPRPACCPDNGNDFVENNDEITDENGNNGSNLAADAEEVVLAPVEELASV